MTAFYRFLLWRCTFAAGSSLVGPGAVGSYQGGGGRRFGGFTRVTEPPVGFFVGGSSIRPMNGLYSRERQFPSGFSHSFAFSYRNDFTGWRLCLVSAPADVKRSTGKQTEWVLIDPDKADRFRHDGDQYIPGSGRRWSHVHRTDGQPNPKAGHAVAQAVEDDEEELPWQVVGVGEDEMLQRLKKVFSFYKHEVQAAIAGQNLPALPVGNVETAPPEGLQIPAADLDTETCEGASLQNAEALLSSLQGWAAAVLAVRVAHCERCLSHFEAAARSLKKALAAYPRYARALEELGKLQLDQGLYEQAQRSFETLLRVDRAWPSVAYWLVRVRTLQRRQETQFLVEKLEVMKGQTPECIAWRQTGACSPTGPLEPAADRSCRDFVDRGNSGFCQCVGRGSQPGSAATAAESGCDHEPFTCAAKCQERQQAALSHRITEAAAQLAAEVSKSLDHQPCTLPRGELPDWCQPNHYRVLGIRCDLPPHEDAGDELKRAYKRRILQHHPDKPGGSAHAFQRIADAHHVLLDPEKRRAFDEGADFPRKLQQDGSSGETYKEEIEKFYFPERFDFQPFGDPHSDRREAKAREERRVEERRQAALAEAKEAPERTDL